MNAHRLFGEGVIRPIPRRRAAEAPSQGFMVCPPALMGRVGGAEWALGTQELYRLAYEQAKACLAPAWHIQSLLASAN